MQNKLVKVAKLSFLSLLVAGSSAFSYSIQEVNADLSSVRSLSIEDHKNLENSSEGGSWRVFGVQAPMCDRAALGKHKGKLTKFQKEENLHLREKCIADNKLCKNSQKIADKYKVESVCSPVYSEISILTTKAQTVPD